MPPHKITLPPRRAVVVTPIQRPPEQPIPHDRKVLAGLPAFAELCDTSVPSVRHWISQGMPAIRGGAAGGRLLVPVRLARQWLEAQAVSVTSGAVPAAGGAEEVPQC